MKLGAASVYAVLTVVYLASRKEKGPIQGKTIAEELGIPPEMLLKILQQLVRSGLLISKRGPQGGFFMEKSPDAVSLFDILEEIEGDLSRTFSVPVSVQDSKITLNKLRAVCKEVARESSALLRKTTIRQLMADD